MRAAALAGQRTMAINELQSILKNLQDIESQEEELMHAAQDRESQVRVSLAPTHLPLLHPASPSHPLGNPSLLVRA